MLGEGYLVSQRIDLMNRTHHRHVTGEFQYRRCNEKRYLARQTVDGRTVDNSIVALQQRPCLAFAHVVYRGQQAAAFSEVVVLSGDDPG